MGLLRTLFGRREPREPATQFASGHSRAPAAASTMPSARRQILALALRDTLARNGIPSDWIASEPLSARSRAGVEGVQLRLVVRHWDPRLMLHLVGLQNSFLSRLHRLDPVAEGWLMGIVWRIDLPDESLCPALPHPGSWTAATEGGGPAAGAVDRDAGLIAGPVSVDANGRRRELDRLLAGRDAGFGGGPTGDEPTEPMHLQTQPMEMRRDG